MHIRKIFCQILNISCTHKTFFFFNVYPWCKSHCCSNHALLSPSNLKQSTTQTQNYYKKYIYNSLNYHPPNPLGARFKGPYCVHKFRHTVLSYRTGATIFYYLSKLITTYTKFNSHKKPKVQLKIHIIIR